MTWPPISIPSPAVKLLLKRSRSHRYRFAIALCVFCARHKDPAIVNLYDVGIEDENVAYLVMEYVSGKTLQQVLSESAIPLLVPAPGPPIWPERSRCS